MSKSLGNFFTVHDLLDKGVPGEVIRFVFLSTHYSKPMDWTVKKADEAKKTLIRWYRQVGLAESGTGSIHPQVITELANDLNTHAALTECHAMSYAGDVTTLRRSMELLGLLPNGVPDWAKVPGFSDEETGLVHDLLTTRETARRGKRFEIADQIRDGLASAGVVVKDTGGDTEFTKADNFDLNKLDKLWGSV